MESPYPLVEVEEAQRIVLENVSALPAERLPFHESVGQVLARDVVAEEDMPPFPAANVDGFAVVASDAAGVRRIEGEQMAGYVAGMEVRPGVAVRITTGSPVPRGADAVVMVEDTEVAADGETVTIKKRVEPGEGMRPPGSDIARGQLVLEAGTLVGPAEVGLLATVNRLEVDVYRRPRVGVMVTGDELVEPGKELKPGQIRESNRFTLIATVGGMGCIPVDLGIVRDAPGAMEAAIERGIAEADVVISSGGVSMGEKDLVKPYLAKYGEVLFGRVRAKPGKPTTFAVLRGRPFFALPGFPVSSLVAFELYFRPALLKMAGRGDIHRPRRTVTLAHDVRHSRSRTEFQRAVVTRALDGPLTASTTGFQGSARLLSMSGANALLVLPAGDTDLAAGSRVEAIMLDWPVER